jgi:hypothetical protein
MTGLMAALATSASPVAAGPIDQTVAMKTRALFAAPAALPPLVVARFARRQGWHVGASRDHACVGTPRGQCEQATSWASTVRWRDCADCIPPHRTLAALARSGIAIALMQGRETKQVPRRTFTWPTRIGAVVGPIEGDPTGRIGMFAQFGRRHGIDLSLWVFFGRRHPSRTQLARANAELRTASLH